MAVDVLELVRADSAVSDSDTGGGPYGSDGGGGGSNVSSSNIRDALAAGNLSSVEAALGRPYQLTMHAAADQNPEIRSDTFRLAAGHMPQDPNWHDIYCDKSIDRLLHYVECYPPTMQIWSYPSRATAVA